MTGRAWLRFLIVAMFVACLPRLASGCQETHRFYVANSMKGRLFNESGRPISGGRLVIREAGPSAEGPKVIFGGRKGRFVKELAAGHDGGFKVRDVRPGDYWITYMHESEGESFLVRIDLKSRAKSFDLAINNWGSPCYFIDIERNVSKPIGWVVPVSREIE